MAQKDSNHQGNKKKVKICTRKSGIDGSVICDESGQRGRIKQLRNQGYEIVRVIPA